MQTEPMMNESPWEDGATRSSDARLERIAVRTGKSEVLTPAKSAGIREA